MLFPNPADEIVKVRSNGICVALHIESAIILFVYQNKIITYAINNDSMTISNITIIPQRQHLKIPTFKNIP